MYIWCDIRFNSHILSVSNYLIHSVLLCFGTLLLLHSVIVFRERFVFSRHNYCSHELIHNPDLMILFSFEIHTTYMKHNEPIWLSAERIYFLISFLFLWSLFLLLTWMKMYGARVCVCSVYSWWGLSAHTHTPPSFPTRHDPRKAEWQGSG